MIRACFVIYWIWFAFITAILCWYESPNIETSIRIVQLSNLNAFFIMIVPNLIRARNRAKRNDYYWWKLCVFCALARVVTNLVAIGGYREYVMLFFLTIFILLVYFLLDKAMKVNDDSIGII